MIDSAAAPARDPCGNHPRPVSAAVRAGRRRGVAEPSSQAAPSEVTAAPSRVRLLWIEDHPEFMAPLASWLVREGFDVEFAMRGEAGIHMARSAMYAVILVDLILPDIPGIEVLKTLRSAGITTPIIVITGHGSIESAVEALHAGAADFKSKPLRAVDLVQTVRTVLASANSQQRPAGTFAEFPAVGQATPPRAARIARVLVDLISAPNDVHSIEDLCRKASVGIAPATFRRWCAEENIGPGEALEFARLLRGLALARNHGTSPSEWMELDPRTFRSLLMRGGVSDLFQEKTPSFREFIDRQQFVANSLVLKLVQRGCGADDSRPRQGPRRTDATE
jgi:DNA-binding response OmpR family regulator